MTRKELVDLAVQAAGSETELARRLGIENINSAATEINRYRRGQGLKFDRTIEMLRIAGLLHEKPVPPPVGEAELAAVLREVANVLERLERAARAQALPGVATEGEGP